MSDFIVEYKNFKDYLYYQDNVIAQIILILFFLTLITLIFGFLGQYHFWIALIACLSVSYGCFYYVFAKYKASNNINVIFRDRDIYNLYKIRNGFDDSSSFESNVLYTAIREFQVKGNKIKFFPYNYGKDEGLSLYNLSISEIDGIKAIMKDKKIKERF